MYTLIRDGDAGDEERVHGSRPTARPAGRADSSSDSAR